MSSFVVEFAIKYRAWTHPKPEHPRGAVTLMLGPYLTGVVLTDVALDSLRRPSII